MRNEQRRKQEKLEKKDAKVREWQAEQAVKAAAEKHREEEESKVAMQLKAEMAAALELEAIEKEASEKKRIKVIAEKEKRSRLAEE